MMPGVWYRFRAEFRSRWRAWIGLALLVGLASGAVMALGAGARRTDTAYARFLDGHDAYDVLVVNYPEDGTAVYDFDELERLPEVAESARAAFEYFTFDTGNLMSRDGRIGREINRFEILEGRRADPDRPDEMIVGFALAEEHGIEVGDTVDLIPPAFVELVESGATEDPAGEATPEEIAAAGRLLEVLPDGKLRVVGIEAAPGEFPPQFQVNRPLVHLTPALARVAPVDPDHEVLMVRLHGGSATVDEFLAELESRSNGLLPQVTVQGDHAAAVERSIHLQAVALWLLAGLTALAAVLIVGQLVSRLTYIESDEHPTLRALGMTVRERVALGVLRTAVIATVGTAVGVAAAIFASRFFPTGLARTAEPAPGYDVDLLVLPAGAALSIFIVTALSVWPTWRAARAPGRGGERGAVTRSAGFGDAVARRGLPAPTAIGMSMALDQGRGRSAVPVRTALASVTLGIAALVAAFTFGASLAHLVETPRLYGVSWDLQLVTFEGDGLGPEAVRSLRRDARVDGVARGIAATNFAVDVGGERVGMIALEPLDGNLTPPILGGRAPAAPDEIALGKNTLRALDANVGDRVRVRVPGLGADTIEMHIVGTSVFPTLSEFAQLGEGALVTLDAVPLLDPSESEPEDDAELFVRLAPGADGEAVTSDLDEQVGGGVYAFPGGEPTDIVNFGRVEAMPFVLGAILAAIAVATLGHLLLSAVRRRRRDLAVLKTLGFVRSQVAGSVAVQATTVGVVGVLVGVPLGVIVGRWVWGLMAEDLGVVSQPVVPGLVLVLVATATIVLANLIALIPGQIAARTKPTTDLRPE